MNKDLFELYKLYLYALKTRQEYGDKYGDTEELIKIYEEKLKNEGVLKDKERESKKRGRK